MFRWVLIEIELDLFVDYKTSFAFVLPTDAVKSSKHYYAIFIRATRFESQDINKRFLSNLTFNVLRWVLIEIEFDLCGRRIKVERKL